MSRLAHMVKEANIGIDIDAEEADRLELSSRRDRNRHAGSRIEGIGRLRDCHSSVRQGCSSRSGLSVRKLANELDRKIKIRLVKGAYMGFAKSSACRPEGYRIFPSTRGNPPRTSPISAARRKLLTMTDRVHPLFACHQRPHGLVHLAYCRRRCGIRVPAHSWDGRSASRRDKAPEECPVQDLRDRRQVQGAAPLSGEADARKRREQFVRDSALPISRTMPRTSPAIRSNCWRKPEEETFRRFRLRPRYSETAGSTRKDGICTTPASFKRLKSAERRFGQALGDVRAGNRGDWRSRAGPAFESQAFPQSRGRRGRGRGGVRRCDRSGARRSQGLERDEAERSAGTPCGGPPICTMSTPRRYFPSWYAKQGKPRPTQWRNFAKRWIFCTSYASEAESGKLGPASRHRRVNFAVEFPAGDIFRPDRGSIGGRQRRHRQAGRTDAADRQIRNRLHPQGWLSEGRPPADSRKLGPT